METKVFGEELKRLGFDFFTGVPCSFLKDLINYAINECDYVGAANEGDAVAIASGAYLGGRKAVVLMQNSGLTNAVSPLTSLNYTFKLPVLGFVSLRGEAGVADEPQHELMGQITTQMLDLMQVKWAYLADEWEEAQIQLQQADNYIAQNQTFFFVVKKGTFNKEALQQSTHVFTHQPSIINRPTDTESPRLTRFQVLDTINRLKDASSIQLATTGFTGRELYEVEDSAQNLYMVGSMGCISSLGLGVSLAQPSKKVIAIDGDGALLMRMGNLATNGQYGPSNMLHVVLDNQCHDSTGGQDTVSATIDFAAIAAGCGYRHVEVVYTTEQLEAAITLWQQQPQLTFIYIPTIKGAKDNLSRPSIKPYEVKERLVKYING
ncbi:phosphonopyruvate decarboxylase [Paenibacillus kyungheensis]|uniref:Phosphonopyruvate decarboxylase n=1 Tax=Paenibacillus kyungheensis TaxID=1452732 RepID=A0AAX3M9Y5_9BACL|nr:phosphonopyruvate decarboxylase [Paenibacillus kyungheensis]WCT58213.1 phosphonopyruvate decarboxylase [Paenibacillus kyungheensis]